MFLAERVQQAVQRLHMPFQAEALDFVECLPTKAERETAQEESRDWARLSLSYAMRGMEGEDDPACTTSDLQVVFA